MMSEARSPLALLCLVVALAGCQSAILRSVSPAAQKHGERLATYSLPRGQAEIRVMRSSQHLDTLEYVTTTIIPDPRQRYRLDYDALSTASDEVKVELTTAGLLDQITITSEEHSDAIAIKIAQTAIEAAKLAAVGAVAPEPEAPREVYRTRFDPTSCEDVAWVNVQLKELDRARKDEIARAIDERADDRRELQLYIEEARAKARDEASPSWAKDLETKADQVATERRPAIDLARREIRRLQRLDTEHAPLWIDVRDPVTGVSILPCGTAETIPLDDSAEGSGDALLPLGSESGIYYRLPRAFTLVLGTDDRYREAAEVDIIVPDPTPGAVSALDIARTIAVRRVTTIDFENGLLKSVSLNKPSEALELTAVPYEIIKAVAALPAELIQLKVDYSSKETALAEARKKQAVAEQALLDLLKQIRDGTYVPGAGDPLSPSGTRQRLRRGAVPGAGDPFSPETTMHPPHDEATGATDAY
jgi:hypothetical protein